MKKIHILTALIMLGIAGYVVAGELRSTPHGDHPQALATADYGGVYVSTDAVFKIGVSTVVQNASGVFYGVMFSSGNIGALDFVDVFDSTDTRILDGAQMRLYNINGSTMSSTGSSGNGAAGFSGPPKPTRFNKGLLIRPNVATYNLISVLYYKEP